MTATSPGEPVRELYRRPLTAWNDRDADVAERTGSGWAIVLFQNTPARYHGRPEAAAQHTAELQPQATASHRIT